MECTFKKNIMNSELIYLLNQFTFSGRGIPPPFLQFSQKLSVKPEKSFIHFLY